MRRKKRSSQLRWLVLWFFFSQWFYVVKFHSISTWVSRNLDTELLYRRLKKKSIESVSLITFLPSVALHRLGVVHIFCRLLFRYQLEMQTNQKEEPLKILLPLVVCLYRFAARRVVHLNALRMPIHAARIPNRICNLMNSRSSADTSENKNKIALKVAAVFPLSGSVNKPGTALFRFPKPGASDEVMPFSLKNRFGML